MLSSEVIAKLAARKGVRKIAVENFLFSMTGDASECFNNLEMDARMYKWNAATYKAISDGIAKAFK